MLIEFVAHSSFVMRQGDVHMLCDPWLQGTAFDDAWALLAQPVFKPEDFESITHIWFSHEHPDHFSPRSLAMIPEELRRRITVLFHATDDHKIANHCKKMGFGQVNELPLGHWVHLAPGFDMLCNTWEGTDDSWLLVRTPDCRLLNLNDCQVSTPQQAAALYAETGDVDILATQFSISAWDGNPEDLPRRRRGAQAMLDRTVLQAKTLHARHVIPFASFIWFCHEENDYMNECLVEPGVVADLLRRETTAQPVVLYPGDTWDAGSTLDSTSAIERYRADLASLPARPRFKAAPVDLAELEQVAARFSQRLSRDVSPTRLRLRAARSNLRYLLQSVERRSVGSAIDWLWHLLTLRARPAHVWLTDHQKSVDYSLRGGLKATQRARGSCDIELSSAALLYAMKFLWGGESLQVNGRFRELYPNGRMPLYDYLHVACAMNHEEGAQARPL